MAHLSLHLSKYLIVGNQMPLHLCVFRAMLEEEEKWMSRQSESLSEKRAVLLISEELFLDVSRDILTDFNNAKLGNSFNLCLEKEGRTINLIVC